MHTHDAENHRIHRGLSALCRGFLAPARASLRFVRPWGNPRRLVILGFLVLAGLVWTWAGVRLAAGATPVEIKVTWLAGPGAAEDGFVLSRKVGLPGVYTFLGSVGKGILAFTDIGPLAGGQTYCYQVVAFNIAGSSLPSPEACVTLPAPPGTPGGVTAVIIPAVP